MTHFQLKLAVEAPLNTGLPRACDKLLSERKGAARLKPGYECGREREAGEYSEAMSVRTIYGKPDKANSLLPLR